MILKKTMMMTKCSITKAKRYNVIKPLKMKYYTKKITDISDFRHNIRYIMNQRVFRKTT